MRDNYASTKEMVFFIPAIFIFSYFKGHIVPFGKLFE